MRPSAPRPSSSSRTYRPSPIMPIDVWQARLHLIGVSAHVPEPATELAQCSHPPLLLPRVLTTGRYRAGHPRSTTCGPPPPTDRIVSRHAAGDGAHNTTQRPGRRTRRLPVPGTVARWARLVTAARSARAVTAAISPALPRETVWRRVGLRNDGVRCASTRRSSRRSPRSGRLTASLHVFNRAAEVTVTKAGLCTT